MPESSSATLAAPTPTTASAVVPTPPALSLGKLVALMTALSLLAGWASSCATRLGVELNGPAAAIRRDSLRIARLEARQAQVERTLELLTYLTCVQIRRADPAAVPPSCNEAQP